MAKQKDRSKKEPSKKERPKPKDSTRQHVFAASGNVCAFPDCDATIVDLDHFILVGEIAHIEGERPDSARSNPDQSDEDNRAFENLLAMCERHHKVVDSPKTRKTYSVEWLRDLQKSHE